MTVEIVHANIVNIISAHVVCDDRTVIAICHHPVVAERIAELWDRHGLCDVPADASLLGEAPDPTPISPVDNFPTHPQKES